MRLCWAYWPVDLRTEERRLFRSDASCVADTGLLASCSNCIHQVIDLLYKFQCIKREAAIYLQSLFCILDTGTRWCKMVQDVHTGHSWSWKLAVCWCYDDVWQLGYLFCILISALGIFLHHSLSPVPICLHFHWNAIQPNESWIIQRINTSQICTASWSKKTCLSYLWLVWTQLPQYSYTLFMTM